MFSSGHISDDDDVGDDVVALRKFPKLSHHGDQKAITMVHDVYQVTIIFDIHYFDHILISIASLYRSAQKSYWIAFPVNKV